MKILPVFLLLLTACTTVSYDRAGDDIKFRTSSLFTRKAIKDLDYGIGTNGFRSFRLKGYGNDQTEVISAAVTAALEAYQKAQPVP
jgi:uncharacterized protein YutD